MKKLLFALLAIAVSPPLFAQESGTITSTQCVAIDVKVDKSTVGIQVTGTWTGTLQPQVSIQGQPAANTQVVPSTSTTPQATITGNGVFYANVGGVGIFQICGNTVASGTANIFLNGSKGVNAGTLSFGGGSIAAGTLGQPAVYKGANSIGTTPLFFDASQFGASVAGANAADTAMGGTSGILVFPETFDSTLDYFLNTNSTWSDGHCVLDFRTRTPAGFSSSPGSYTAPWTYDCLRLSDPNPGVTNVVSETTTTFHAKGGVNPTNGTGKSVFTTHQVSAYINGTGQDYSISANTVKQGIGDSIAFFGQTTFNGNCIASADECAEGLRVQVNQDTGAQLLTGTVSSYNAGTGALSTTTATNSFKVGVGRLWVNLTSHPDINANGNNVPYAVGTLASVSGSGTVTFVGSATTWATDFCPSGTGGAGCNTNAQTLCFSHDADTLNTAKFVIPITGITDNTHLTLAYNPDNVATSYPTAVIGGDTYHIYYCNAVTDFSFPFSNTNIVTFPTASGYQGWAASDSIEQENGFNFQAHGIRVVMNTNTPYPGTALSDGIRIANIGSQNVSAGVALQGSFAHLLTWNAALVPDNQTVSGAIKGPSFSSPLINITDTTNDQIIYQQNAATSNSKFHHTPASNTFAFGTTGGGDLWTVISNTGATAQKGNFSFSGGKGQHFNMQAANNDVSGTVTVTASTTGSATFTTNYSAAPVCTLTPQADPTAVGVWWVTTSTSTVTANVKTSGTLSFTYQCFGNPN